MMRAAAGPAGKPDARFLPTRVTFPEVIGKESSHQDDSFSSGLLEYPQYTRPYDYRGMVVPDVLMSGHHEKIRQWRLYESLKKTYERRPDLLENYQLTAEEEKMLAEIKENKE